MASPTRPLPETNQSIPVSSPGILSEIFQLGTILIAVGICVATYHFFVVVPGHSKSSDVPFYVADLNILADAKVVQMLRTSSAQGMDEGDLDEAMVTQEMRTFREKLKSDFLALSEGNPVFMKGSVITTNSGVIDLTFKIAEINSLDLSVSLEDYLKAKNSTTNPFP